MQEVYDYLRGICSDVHVTQGDFDEQKSFAEDEVMCIGDFRIGLCHGHQVPSHPCDWDLSYSVHESKSPPPLSSDHMLAFFNGQ